MFIYRGTFYYLKRELKRRWGVCKFCGRRSRLSSFDAYKFYHLIFTAGKVHVDGLCPICGKGSEMEYDQWPPLRETALLKAQERYAPDLNNYENAIKLHKAYELYGSDRESAEFAALMEERFPRNIAVCYYLANYYRALADYERALIIYDDLIRKSPGSEELIYSLAHLYFEKGDYSEALDYFFQCKGLSLKGDMERLLQMTKLLYLDAQYFKARKVLDFIKASFPELADRSNSFEALMYRVGKKTGLLAPEYSFYRIKQLSIAASFILTLSIVFAAVNFYLALNQPLYLTNYLTKPVKLTFRDNRRFQLAPGSLVKSRIDEGRHRVKIEIEGGPAYYRELTVDNTLFQRFSRGNIFVLNIKGAALMLWGEVTYSKKEVPGDSSRSNFKLFAGHEYYTFRNISFPFRTPPDSIYFKRGRSVEVKSYLKLLETSDRRETLEMLLQYRERIERKALMRYLIEQLELEDDENFQRLLQRLKSEDERPYLN